MGKLYLLLRLYGESGFVVGAESPPEVDKTDQWLGVAVASQATDRGLALVGLIDSYLFDII